MQGQTFNLWAFTKSYTSLSSVSQFSLKAEMYTTPLWSYTVISLVTSQCDIKIVCGFNLKSSSSYAWFLNENANENQHTDRWRDYQYAWRYFCLKCWNFPRSYYFYLIKPFSSNSSCYFLMCVPSFMWYSTFLTHMCCVRIWNIADTRGNFYLLRLFTKRPFCWNCVSVAHKTDLILT